MSDRSRVATVLTIMMTDVVRSTALRRARGDRDADAILGLQAGIVNEKVTEFGGWVRKSLGDGFLISFPSTVAAVRAAAAIQTALHEHNAADPQHAVEIRIGIHTGQVTERDGDLHGQAVDAAARVMAEAIGGQILTSEQVRKHAEPQVDLLFSTQGCSGCAGSRTAGGYTRCPGTTRQRPRGQVLCLPGSHPSLRGMPSGPVCAGW